MGTYVPEFAAANTFELNAITFIDSYLDSCTTLAVQTAMDVASDTIFCVGYDGYPGSVLSEKEVALTHENQTIFNAYKNFTGKSIISLTPSLYKELVIKSIYQII